MARSFTFQSKHFIYFTTNVAEIKNIKQSKYFLNIFLLQTGAYLYSSPLNVDKNVKQIIIKINIAMATEN
jgi:hypothetical protein